jgi:protein-tyrosine phosphatase
MSARPETLPCPDEAPAEDLVRRVREALEAGGLVAMPTETVYGVAARADDPAAAERLRAAKGSPADRALTWHAGGMDALERFERAGPAVRRLAERYWPGPLTLVIEGAPDGLEAISAAGLTGVRVPAHAGTRGVLAALPFPVAMTSANTAGEPPLPSAAAVAETLGDRLELVLDGGEPRLGEASGVLALGAGRFELLREGLLPIEDLRRTAGLRIAFVCTGNTCRSPMAEALCRAELAFRLGYIDEPVDPETAARGDAVALPRERVARIAQWGFEVSSMGVHAGAGSPASRNSVSAMAAHGLDLTAHSSSPALDVELAGLDRVYCLTRGHLEALRMLLPPGRDGNLALLSPEGDDVDDPIGGSVADYMACARQIHGYVRARADLDAWA